MDTTERIAGCLSIEEYILDDKVCGYVVTLADSSSFSLPIVRVHGYVDGKPVALDRAALTDIVVVDDVITSLTQELFCQDGVTCSFRVYTTEAE